MRLVLFDDYKPGLLKGNGVVDVSEVTRRVAGRTGQETMQGIITHFDQLKADLERALSSGREMPLANVQLRAPLPRPGKIMMMGANFREFTQGVPALPIWGFLKSPEAILDPGGTIVLPGVDFIVCHHEAEMVAVIGKQGKDIPAAQGMDYVFGYCNGIDVSPRMPLLQNTLLNKGCDPCQPLGPCIVTKDEVPDVDRLQVRLWVNGELRQDFPMSDIGHPLPDSIHYFSERMSIMPGDILSLGTNHAGLGALQDGDTVEIEIDGLGRLTNKVSDPLKRSWPRGTDPGYAHLRLREQLLAGKA